jgi:hypothetical protein
MSIRRHLGGTDASRNFMNEVREAANARGQHAVDVAFAAPHPPLGLGLPLQATTAEAFSEFCRRCARPPHWMTFLARGATLAALASAARAGLGLSAWEPLLLFLGMGGACFFWYRRAMDRLRRLGAYVEERIRADYGSVLFDYAQRAAGTKDHDGIYQALSDYIEQQSIPRIARFEQERDQAVTAARVPQPFPKQEGTTGYFAGEGEVGALHGIIRDALGDSELADDALDLLRGEYLFENWPALSMDEAIRKASAYMRQRHLADWETGPMSLGAFLRRLMQPRYSEEEGLDRAFLASIRRQLDLLAMRALPLALRFPTQLERANAETDRRNPKAAIGSTADPEAVDLRLYSAVPASLRWAEEYENSGSSTVPAQVPAGSAAAILAEYGTGLAAREVIRAESDEAAFLLLISKVPLEAISWVFGDTADENAQPASADETVPYPLGRGHLRIAPGRLGQGTSPEEGSSLPSHEMRP